MTSHLAADSAPTLLHRQLACLEESVELQRRLLKLVAASPPGFDALGLSSADLPGVVEDHDEVGGVMSKDSALLHHPGPDADLDPAPGAGVDFGHGNHSASAGTSCAKNTNTDGLEESCTLPWQDAEKSGSWFQVLGSSMKAPSESMMLHCDHMEFVNAALLSRSSTAVQNWAVGWIQNQQLYTMLLVTFTVPLILALPSPKTKIDSIIMFLAYNLAMSNFVLVTFLTYLLPVVQAVGEANFHAWAFANKAVYRFPVFLNTVIAWLMAAVITLHMLQHQLGLSTEAMPHDARLGLSIANIVFFVAIIQSMFKIANVASRSALYSGAMAEAKVPMTSTLDLKSVPSEFFAATISGVKLGKNKLLAYYAQQGQSSESKTPQASSAKYALRRFVVSGAN